MTTYGLTATGFSAPTYSDIKAEIEASLQGVFGTSIDLSPQGVFGQIVGIFAERESAIWDAAQEVYAGFDPDEATGSALDALAALTGTIREGATHSTVTATITGTAGTTVPAGTLFSVTGTGVQFETLASATFSGTFTTTTVDCQSVDTGPLVALTGTLTVIDTPVDGLTSVTNALDADLGRDEETDAALRLRREEELRGGANAALEAIREAVLNVTGIDECVVFENVSDATDSDSIPPHAVNVVADGSTADEDDVAAAIFGSVAAGIATYGTDHTVSVQDTQGVYHTIKYDDATDVDCYTSIAITYDANHFNTTPAVYEDAVNDIIAAYESDYLVMGKDLVGRAVGAKIFAGMEGIIDCVVKVAKTPTPTGDSVTIALREIARTDSARTTITVTPGTP